MRRRPQDLDLVALGAGAGAAALGIAAHTGPVLPGLAVALVLGRIVQARSVAHLVLWLCTPLLVWIGWDSGRFLAGVACVALQSALCAWLARGRPAGASDAEAAVRVTLAVAAGIAALAFLAFGNVYR